MKILSCHIENFGGLKEENITFNEGLNVILRENGWGKSTLAAFIKAMLYGLPATTKRSLYENDRRRLTPWNGGAFGGSMVFETDGEIYRVERFFGAKESEDTFSLTDEKTKLESKDFTQNLGVELTALDAESFEKTVFLPQKSIEIEMTDSISAKLSDLIESGDDVNNYDSAVNSLADSRRYYAHLKGNGGKIYENEVKLHGINDEIQNIEGCFANINDIESKLNDVKITSEEQKAELIRLEKNLKLAEEYELKKEKIARFNSLKKSIDETEKRLSLVSVNFKNGIPMQNETDTCRENITKLTQTDANILALKNSVNETVTAEIRQGYFENNVPDETEMARVTAQCTKLGELSRLCEEEKEKQRERQRKNSATNKKRVSLSLALITVGVIFAGASVLFLQKLGIFITLIVLGVIFAGLGAFLLISKKVESVPDEFVAHKELLETQTEIDAFLSKYNLKGERMSAVFEAKEKLSYLLRAEAQNRRTNEEVLSLTEERDSIDKSIRAFLNNYGEDDLSSGYTVALDKINQNLTKFTLESERKKTLSNELDEFLKDNDKEELSQPLTPPEEEADILRNAISQAREEIESLAKSSVLLNSRKNELESKTDIYNDLLNERDNLILTIEEDKEKVKIIDKTMEFLEKAKVGLSTRYLDKMADGFGKYASEICNIDEYNISAKLDLTFKKEGKGRSIDYFSTGYRSLAGFCMRLSLSDALYEGEKPFLVLDDPFVNLDDQKYEKVKELLNKLSKDRQIIYFICRKDG